MKIRPMPRLILIIAAVAGIGYGASQFTAKSGPDQAAAMPSLQNSPPAEPVREATAPAPSVESRAAPVAVVEQPVSPVAAEQPNAGLDKLLNAGMKK